MFVSTESPPISDTFFEDILDENEFKKAVWQEYVYHASFAGYRPEFSGSAMHDVHQCVMNDIERLASRMNPDTPDHFKQAGHIAYWLRRFRPVIKLKDVDKDTMLSPKQEEVRFFFDDYGHEFLAFVMGYGVCMFFEKNSGPPDKYIPSELDMTYLTDVCYMMKYKGISPHSMNVLYRSFFRG